MQVFCMITLHFLKVMEAIVKLVATMVMAEEQVRAIVPDIEFVQANSAAEALAAAVDADIVWLGGFRDIIPQLVQQGKHYNQN